MQRVTVSFILFLVFCDIKAQDAGECKTPDNMPGQCKSLFNCEEILEIVKKRTKGYQDLLREAQCGFIGTTPMVCCPQLTSRVPNNQCFTPDNNVGQCIGIQSCPHLAKLLNAPSQQNMAYLNSLRCNGAVQDSVCCGPMTSNTGGSTNDCKNTVSATPPDPNSKCCGLDASTGNKIYGGTEVGIDEYPWLVLIEYSNANILCGGSLISGKYVLTAAHCVAGPVLNKGRPTQIRLGEYDRTKEGPDCKTAETGGLDCTEGAIRIPIERTIVHPEYKPDSSLRRHDIGLIRMTRLAPYTEFIRPICLPTSDIAMTGNFYNLTTAGWGAVSDRERSSGVKLYVDLPFISQDRCQQLYNYLQTRVNFWRGQMCAGGESGKDSCKGDSGGPLMYLSGRQHNVVGIASFGHRECGTTYVPGVYTNVFEYVNWIKSNIVA